MKRKYKSIITKRIFRSLHKLGVTVLVLMIFSSVGVMRGTNAGFLDEEKSEGNVLSATTLDFSVSSATDFSPKVSPSKEALRAASISKAGLADFRYQVSVHNISGDDDLCDALEIKDDLDDTYQNLDSYISSGTDNITKTDWNFTVKLMDNDEELADETCDFDLKFEAWQADRAYGTGGFVDVETLSSKVDSEHWTNIADHLVVNEVYYDVASDKGAEGDNEWVEIYNPTSGEVNLKNWKICDASDCDTIATADLKISANGYAVITKDSSTWPFWSSIPGNALKIELNSPIGSGLNNDGDRVILKNDSGTEIDAMSYGTDIYAFDPTCPDVADGHSLARKPAGQDLNIKDDFENLSSPNPGTNPHTVVMNEIMPDPVDEDDAKMPGGEWIELYNYGEYQIDLKDWTLKDGDGDVLEIKDSNTSSESTVIVGGERLVVYRGGDGDFNLKKNGEVQLLDEKKLIKDSYTFGEIVEGKSIARFPDAVGPWIDPEATPGEENKLGEKELDAFRVMTFDSCFSGKGRLEKKSKEEICAPEFLKYLGMIKELDDDKINSDVELSVLELKKAQEEKKLADLLKETKKLNATPDVSTSAEESAITSIEENIPASAESTDDTDATKKEKVEEEAVILGSENKKEELEEDEDEAEIEEDDEEDDNEEKEKDINSDNPVIKEEDNNSTYTSNE